MQQSTNLELRREDVQHGEESEEIQKLGSGLEAGPNARRARQGWTGRTKRARGRAGTEEHSRTISRLLSSRRLTRLPSTSAARRGRRVSCPRARWLHEGRCMKRTDPVLTHYCCLCAIVRASSARGARFTTLQVLFIRDSPAYPFPLHGQCPPPTLPAPHSSPSSS